MSIVKCVLFHYHLSHRNNYIFTILASTNMLMCLTFWHTLYHQQRFNTWTRPQAKILVLCYCWYWLWPQIFCQVCMRPYIYVKCHVCILHPQALHTTYVPVTCLLLQLQRTEAWETEDQQWLVFMAQVCRSSEVSMDEGRSGVIVHSYDCLWYLLVLSSSLRTVNNSLTDCITILSFYLRN